MPGRPAARFSGLSRFISVCFAAAGDAAAAALRAGDGILPLSGLEDAVGALQQWRAARA